MNLREYRESQRRRRFAIVRNFCIVGLGIVLLLVISAALAGRQAAASDSSLAPVIPDQMQDMMIMQQNTAAWTPQGLVVLQGNRLLHYTPDLQLQQVITLPVRLEPARTSEAMPRTANTPESMAEKEMPAICSEVTARILPAADGLIVIRGQQVVWIDSKFKVAGQAKIPDLPPLTAEELAAVCPLSQPMMMGRGMAWGGPGEPAMPMPGAAGMPAGHHMSHK